MCIHAAKKNENPLEINKVKGSMKRKKPSPTSQMLIQVHEVKAAFIDEGPLEIIRPFMKEY